MTYAFIHTVKFFVLGVILAISFFLLLGTNAYAYFTTAQDAVVLEDNTLLFTIEYQFGHEKHDVHMPVIAHNTETKSPATVSYTILNQAGEQVLGKTMGIVFSNAKLIESGEYLAKKTEARKFTLAVLFSPSTPVAGDTYRMQVNHLPFAFDGKQQLELNPSELKYYTTKHISLN